MARRIFEFYCNDCDGWILVNLNEELRGSILVQCPACGRRHPRTLVNGELATPTFEVKIAGKSKVHIVRGGSDLADEVIVPMPSAYSKESRLDKVQHKKTGGLVGTVELWLQHVMNGG
jgi:hypothetical protein